MSTSTGNIYKGDSLKKKIIDTVFEREKVIEYFHDLENFKYYHSSNPNLDEIEGLIME